jgi:hypothetical protein
MTSSHPASALVVVEVLNDIPHRLDAGHRFLEPTNALRDLGSMVQTQTSRSDDVTESNDKERAVRVAVTAVSIGRLQTLVLAIERVLPYGDVLQVEFCAVHDPSTSSATSAAASVWSVGVTWL